MKSIHHYHVFCITFISIFLMLTTTGMFLVAFKFHIYNNFCFSILCQQPNDLDYQCYYEVINSNVHLQKIFVYSVSKDLQNNRRIILHDFRMENKIFIISKSMVNSMIIFNSFDNFFFRFVYLNQFAIMEQQNQITKHPEWLDSISKHHCHH